MADDNTLNANALDANALAAATGALAVAGAGGALDEGGGPTQPNWLDRHLVLVTLLCGCAGVALALIMTRK